MNERTAFGLYVWGGILAVGLLIAGIAGTVWLAVAYVMEWWAR